MNPRRSPQATLATRKTEQINRHLPITRGGNLCAPSLFGLPMPNDAIQWETAACPLCGCANDREFLRAPAADGVEYRLGQCLACEMVFTNPRPDETSIL